MASRRATVTQNRNQNKKKDKIKYYEIKNSRMV